LTSAAGNPPDRTRSGLARMMHAHRIAVIGASERNPFASAVLGNLDRIGFTGEILLVNPRGEPVNGRPVLRSASELDGGIDAAFICVPQAMVVDTVAEAAAAGVTGFVVVASGFAEVGAEGAARQQLLTDLVSRERLTLLGPNSLGFVNYVDRICLSVVGNGNPGGNIGIASVSGSVGAYLEKAVAAQGLGLSHLILTGNEAGLVIADAIEFLVDDPHTTSIAVFLETVYEPRRFAAAAQRALRAGKPIVVIKAGASEGTARLVAAHTGALAGDDRVFDAIATELGISRVETYEDMIATATLLGAVGPIARPGVAAVTISGGSGEILSDLANAAGVPFPAFSAHARAALDASVSRFGQSHNPLDVTGAALGDPGLWERCLRAIAADETIGLTLCLWDPPAASSEGWMSETLAAIVRGYAAYSAIPPLLQPVAEPVTQFGRDALRAAGIPGTIGGLRPAIVALSHLRSWSARARDPRPVSLFAEPAERSLKRPRHERALLDALSAHGVPVIPGILARTAEEAAAVAAGFGYPLALKLVAPALAHKTEIGGVRLGLLNADELRAAFAALMAIEGVGDVEGVAISPMRAIDAELLVAVSHDPSWGPMLTMGLGGIWVEAFNDTRLLPLPANAGRIEQALRSLRAAPLLTGGRGRPILDLDAVVQAVQKIVEAALAFGPDLTLLEINPLAISAAGAEVLDALAVWRHS
jgi:acyl-CoA synthetase (NDP forming)